MQTAGITAGRLPVGEIAIHDQNIHTFPGEEQSSRDANDTRLDFLYQLSRKPNVYGWTNWMCLKTPISFEKATFHLDLAASSCYPAVR